MARTETQKFARGFKTEANRLATEVRAELGLDHMDRLEPAVLADHLAIPLVPLTDYTLARPDAVKHFSTVEPSAFSALTVFDGPARLVVFNDAHRDGRQSNSIVHELSHGLLGHPPHAAVDPATGCRIWYAQLEAEADFLAGVLLVPEWAALQIVRRRIARKEAAELFGVSAALIDYRINVTGARSRVARMQH